KATRYSRDRPRSCITDMAVKLLISPSGYCQGEFIVVVIGACPRLRCPLDCRAWLRLPIQGLVVFVGSLDFDDAVPGGRAVLFGEVALSRSHVPRKLPNRRRNLVYESGKVQIDLRLAAEGQRPPVRGAGL